MECSKCHTVVAENATVCPVCKKVLQLKCPNCHSLSQNQVCEKCGYVLLVKCSKCSRLNSTEKDFCSKCGFSLKTSLAYNECEIDEFASITITLENLKSIKKALKSKELYAKFLLRVKNLLMAQVKANEGKLIIYGETFVFNLNKELSFATSSHKAIRLAIKIANAFVELNTNLVMEWGFPLGLKLSVNRKFSEDLLEKLSYKNNVKKLLVTQKKASYQRGFQIIMDQYVWDQINKDFKTDSLYSLDIDGQSIMFYELILDSYLLPPKERETEDINVGMPVKIQNNNSKDEDGKDIYSFKMFDINAKCRFENSTAPSIIEKMKSFDLKKEGKIISIKSDAELGIEISDLINFYRDNEYKVVNISCTEETEYRPWGFFETLFREVYRIPSHNSFINLKSLSPVVQQTFRPILDLIYQKSLKSMSAEDARFAYMEIFGDLLSSLSKTVIIIEGFEYLDDTSIQTMELYFDKFKKVIPNFVFINHSKVSVHSKIKGLLRTNLYTEISLGKASLDSMLATLKSDATDFIQSFYYEKLQENCNGSFLYFNNFINYLKETGVLIDFDNRLMVKENRSVVVSSKLKNLFKSRIKNFSKNMDLSLILAYSTFLGYRFDYKSLVSLGINDIQNQLNTLIESSILRVEGELIYINNYNFVVSVLRNALKYDTESFLAKNVIAKLGKGLDDTIVILITGVLGAVKEQYLTLWKNSQLAINAGDYDAYLKNCLGFLSLTEKVKSNVTPDEIEENKRGVYNNILMYLYSYSPEKIYFIENILLMDAIKQEDDEKIVKLSNLMLQGALISSNYTDALGLLHNILSRMRNATLIVDGKVNTKFLLLSLVNIEILYNIGEYKSCVDIANDLLSVLSLDIIEKIKPAGFSINLFVSHILDTMRLVGLAKLHLLDDDIEEFFVKIESIFQIEVDEKNSIKAIQDFLSGKVYSTFNIENATAFSKVIYLVLQECSKLEEDYKTFAQNIYQAKLLSNEIHQKEFEYICDLLIAYAYYKVGAKEKAGYIYNDIYNISDSNAIFAMLLFANYLKAVMELSNSNIDNSLSLINDSLALLQKQENQSKIFYVLFEKLLIKVLQSENTTNIDIEAEMKKVESYQDKMKIFFD